jgi:FKBP-type peptidyl-prolyl cis-trans isomerase
MKRGARRTLIVPYWLGYGETGNPPLVPPRATLVFELELVDFHP